MVDPWEAVHDRSFSDYQATWDRLVPGGFRPITACVYGTGANPLYAAVFAQRPGPPFAGIHGADATALQSFFDQNAAAGYSTTILSATGSVSDPVFLCVMEQTGGPTALTRFGLSRGDASDPATLEFWLAQAEQQDWLPICVGSYGDPSDLRYYLVATGNPQRLLWSVAGPEDFASYQARFDAQVNQYARPAFVDVGPGGYHSIFREDDIGPYWAQHGMDSAGYQTTFNQRVGEGFVPILVEAGTMPEGNRFAAVFARRNRFESRQLTVTGASVPALAPVDLAVENYVRMTGTRSASVAIAAGDRLVYARAFTWAEPDYPLTQPDSTYRIASLSKPITALACFALIDGGRLGLDDLLLDRLSLTTPKGVPFAPGTGQITVRHLLAHSSGLGGVPDAYDVVQAFGTTLPASEQEVGAFVLTQQLAFSPGAQKQYSNAAYLLLGLVIEAVSGQTYFEAVRQLVLQPLGLQRPYLTSSHRGDLPAGAVRHHYGGVGQPDLELRPSQVAEWAFEWPAWWPFSPGGVQRFGRPIAGITSGAEDYGWFDAFGGWAMAPADYARILAAFDRPTHPLLSPTTVTTMTTPVPAPPDFALGWFVTGTAPSEVQIGHGGAIPGARPGGTHSSLGWSLVTMQNSDAWWLHSAAMNALMTVPQSSWPSGDSWASVGIPAW